jgi:hypothetical protein
MRYDDLLWHCDLTLLGDEESMRCFALSLLVKRLMAIKFVLVCQPRTGSSLLMDVLRQHCGVHVYDEILSPSQHHDFPNSGSARLQMALSDSIERAAGCKLHAFQPLSYSGWHHWEDAWSELYQDLTIRVIVLRRDELAQFAALKLAMEHKDWIGNVELSGERIHVDTGEFYWFRRWNQFCYDVRLSNLKEHRVLNITYESLCHDWDRTLQTVWEHLEVPVISVPRTIWGKESRDLVKNWGQLGGSKG